MLLDVEGQLLVLLSALLLDRLVGDPDWLWKRLPHPVALFGGVIAFCERALNVEGVSSTARQRRGLFALLILVAAGAGLGLAVEAALPALGPARWPVEMLVVSVFLAQKSLADHVAAVAAGLRSGGVAEGRLAVASIVGRDPETLDEAGVCRAAIESLAENFSDGVVAPAFWYALFGLPGLFAYKMLNTADSMIGHRNARYIDFGRASAIADDWANWPAARLSAFLIAVGSLLRRGAPAARLAMTTALRDAGLHRSPNAGWPESAMAGALGLALAGPRIYGGDVVYEPFLNAAGRSAAAPDDIDRALRVYHAACSAGAGCVVLFFLALAG